MKIQARFECLAGVPINHGCWKLQRLIMLDYTNVVEACQDTDTEDAFQFQGESFRVAPESPKL